ncbi:MAG: four helix bundle protein [Planctomycetota bacterium]
MNKLTKEQLSDRLLDFAARTGKVIDAIPETRLGRHIASQMVRCGTSPAPNYEEACAAESRRDFVHKLAIVLKELRESRVWIRLIVKASLLGEGKMADLEDEATQLCNIIAKSIVTAKQNANIR